VIVLSISRLEILAQLYNERNCHIPSSPALIMSPNMRESFLHFSCTTFSTERSATNVARRMKIDINELEYSVAKKEARAFRPTLRAQQKKEL